MQSMQNISPLAELDGITFNYANNFSINVPSMRVYPGDVLGLVGANGAGKTTLLEIISGLIRPKSGTCTVVGRDPFRDQSVYNALGVSLGNEMLFERANGVKFLTSIALLHGLKHDEAETRLSSLSSYLDLDIYSGKRISEYSFGMKKKLSIIASLVHKPKLLIWDEPLEGLDPGAIDALLTLVSTLSRRGTAFIISSHNIRTIVSVTTTINVLARGALVGQMDHPNAAQSAQIEAYILKEIGYTRPTVPAWM